MLVLEKIGSKCEINTSNYYGNQTKTCILIHASKETSMEIDSAVTIAFTPIQQSSQNIKNFDQHVLVVNEFHIKCNTSDKIMSTAD